MIEVWRSKCGRMELRLGKWWEALVDVAECNSLITDPPYSARTETGQPSNRKTIEYGSIDDRETDRLASWASAHVRRWAVVFNDHIGWRWLETAFRAIDWYTFAPVVWCKRAAAPRMAGDGPQTAVEHILIARTTHKFNKDEFGSRPGYYLGMRAVLGADGNNAVSVGGKPVELMRKIVCDYSRPGDLICDPYAGGASTLLAAAIEGRHAIGAECDPMTFELAVKRLEAGYTPSFEGF